MFSLAHFWLGKCSLSDTCPEFHHNSGASIVMSPASASDLAHRQFPILIIGSGCACWMTETTPTPPTSPDFPLFQDRSTSQRGCCELRASTWWGLGEWGPSLRPGVRGKGGQGGQGCPSRGEAWILCLEDHIVRGLCLLHSGPTILGSPASSEGSVLCVSWNPQPHVWLDRGHENPNIAAPLPSEQEIKFLLLLLLFSHSVISSSLQPHGLQHARLPRSSLSPRVCPNSCPLSWWCHPTISSSVSLFCCPQSSPASGSFPTSWRERQIRGCCDRSPSSQNRPTFLQSLDWALGGRGYPTVSALSLKVLIVM